MGRLLALLVAVDLNCCLYHGALQLLHPRAPSPSYVAAAASAPASDRSAEEDIPIGHAATAYASATYTTRPPPRDHDQPPTSAFPPAPPYHAGSQRIEDTTCAVETVEEANTKQLSLILSALSETLFFRLFKVDMQAKCQYDFEKQRWLDDDFLDLGGEAQDSSDIAGRAPPGSSGAERGGSAAARERGTSKGGAEVGSGTEWEDDLDDADDEDLDLDDDDDSDAHSTSTDRGEDVDNQRQPRSTDNREKVDEPFECGGPEQVGGGVAQLMQKPDNLMTSEARKPSKSACTVEAEDAPAFADPAVDRVQTQAERTFSHALTTASDCAEDAPEFWLDMCAKVGEAGNRAEFINLKKNPETNTGYNGRHIWQAMYSENCFSHERMMKKNTGSDDHSHMADWDNTTAAALAAFRSGATQSGTAKGGVGGSNAVALTSADDGRCFEERVLYRLLSGLHSCTTISILYNFYPPQMQTGESASASAISWGKNPGRFMQVFARHPERLKNLYFAFIVLLRATKKAGNFLSTYKWQTGDALEDGKIRELVQRLLDSDKLGSFCASAFEGFDERSMFLSTHVSRREFKKGFQRISALMSCVKCNRCRLHGKLHILGIGAALKILLLTEELLPNSLSREEVVALFNTLHAFSESLIHATELLSLYQWASRSAGAGGVGEMKTGGSGAGGEAEKEDDEDEDDGEDAAEDGVTAEPRGEDGLQEGEDVETVSELLTRAGGDLDRALTRIQADAAGPDLRGRAMENKSSGPSTTSAADAQLLANLQNDVAHALAASSLTSSPAQLSTDLVVVGSGLAGMTTALTALEGGASVVLLEKEPRFGGNTGKASSGINGALMWGELEDSSGGENENEKQRNLRGDSLEAFVQDTMKSGGGRAVPSRVQKLVAESDAALKWLQKAGVDIGLKAVLGGHSAPRTYRPATGNFIGTEVVMVLEKRLREYAGSGQLTILTGARAEGLLTEFGLLGATPTAEDEDEPSPSYRVIGVHGKLNQSRSFRVLAEHTVLATGGFGHDHAKKGSLLWEHRPDLKKFPTTLGQWTTGDGIKMILALPGTALVDMEYVQVHPTGFVDPKEPAAATKTLAAEVLRGVGGILLNEDGERFCDELGTRQYVVDRMLEQTKNKEARSGATTREHGHASTTTSSVRPFYLVLGADAQQAAARHIQHYTRKNLLEFVDLDVANTSEDGDATPVIKQEGQTRPTYGRQLRGKFRAAIAKYREDAGRGSDAFGKKKFLHPPGEADRVVVGRVVPVVHYTMGGVEVDDLHRVVRRHPVFPDESPPTGASTKEPKPPLSPGFPVGDDFGEQIHRGESTARSIVPGLFAVGEIAGGLHGKNRLGGNSLLECLVFGRVVGRQVLPREGVAAPRPTTTQLLEGRREAEEDVSSSEERRAGNSSQPAASGRNASRSSSGKTRQNTTRGGKKKKAKARSVPRTSKEELLKHNSPGDCWVGLYGHVYDLTVYARVHPGGEESILELCGTDGTAAFESVHSRSMLDGGGFVPVGILADAEVNTNTTTTTSSSTTTSATQETEGTRTTSKPRPKKVSSRRAGEL